MKHNLLVSIFFCSLGLKIFEPVALAEDSTQRVLAQRIFSHVAGVKLSLDDPRLVGLAMELANGRRDAAAQRAVDSPEFSQITLFNFFAVKSVRSETPDIPMNDFIAMGIANTLENQPYTRLVTGNFRVQFIRQPGGDFEDSRLDQNNLEGSFSGADKSRINLENIRTVNGQEITSSSGGIILNPEAAGVLTSRQFLKEHAFLGTNRRLVQYAFKNFLCKDITEMRVGGGVGERFINRDVSRAPGGDRGVYRSDCRTCHGVLDPFRRAFAFFDFVGANQETGRPSYQANQVVEKINRNNEFSGGAQVTNNVWLNLASSGSNASHFGWNWADEQNAAHHQGSGASQFGLLIARARAFSTCAVEQVWEAVCKKPGKVIPNNVKSQLSIQFVQDEHNLKNLFVKVAAHPLCLGDV